MYKNEHILNTADILKAILDNTPESIVLISTEHKVLAFNKVIQGVLKMYFGKDIQIGDDYRDWVIPPLKELYIQSFDKAIKGETIVVEKETGTENTSTWFEYKVNPVYSLSHSLIGVTLTAKNIEREKKTLIELENLAENYEAIVENSNASIILMDKTFKVLRFNKDAKGRLLKNLAKEIYIGADFREFLYPNTEEIFYDQFEKAINGIFNETEFSVTFANNRKVWVQARFFPVYKRNGELLGVSLAALNINQRKEAEIALKESEEKFKKILESAPSPILVLDKEMRIVLSNPETENVFGYKNDELQNQNIKIIIPELNFDKLYNFIDHINIHMGSNTFITGKKKDSQDIYIEANINNFHVKNERFILVVIQDITERIKAEQKIVKHLQKLKDIGWQQSHEVRRPVANILGIINALKTDNTLSNPEKEQYLNYLYTSTEELDWIIQKIVNHANSEIEE